MKNEDVLKLVSKTFSVLAKSSDTTQFCDYLANEVLAEFDVVSTCIALLEPNGRVKIVGSWGHTVEKDKSANQPLLWDPTLLTDAIRSSELKAYPTWQTFVEQYPHLIGLAGPGKSFVGVPFVGNGRRTGALGLSFGKELINYEEFNALWQLIGQAGELFVSKSWNSSPSITSAVGDLFVQSLEHSDEVRKLFSKRDLEVAQLTIAGHTISEIARRLNFSESTIKQTRIAIYKRLGVKSVSGLGDAADRLELFQ